MYNENFWTKLSWPIFRFFLLGRSCLLELKKKTFYWPLGFISFSMVGFLELESFSWTHQCDFWHALVYIFLLQFSLSHSYSFSSSGSLIGKVEGGTGQAACPNIISRPEPEIERREEKMKKKGKCTTLSSRNMFQVHKWMPRTTENIELCKLCFASVCTNIYIYIYIYIYDQNKAWIRRVERCLYI